VGVRPGRSKVRRDGECPPRADVCEKGPGGGFEGWAVFASHIGPRFRGRPFQEVGKNVRDGSHSPRPGQGGGENGGRRPWLLVGVCGYNDAGLRRDRTLAGVHGRPRGFGGNGCSSWGFSFGSPTRAYEAGLWARPGGGLSLVVRRSFFVGPADVSMRASRFWGRTNRSCGPPSTGGSAGWFEIVDPGQKNLALDRGGGPRGGRGVARHRRGSFCSGGPDTLGPTFGGGQVAD